jgi:hypothetical protein
VPSEPENTKSAVVTWWRPSQPQTGTTSEPVCWKFVSKRTSVPPRDTTTPLAVVSACTTLPPRDRSGRCTIVAIVYTSPQLVNASEPLDVIQRFAGVQP